MNATYILPYDKINPISKGFKGKNIFSEIKDLDNSKITYFSYGHTNLRTKPKEDIIFWVNPNLELEISEKIFSFDRKLSSLYQTIKDSKSILELQEDWDENGALPCNFNSYIASIEFLITYSKEVLNSYNVIIDSPEINIARDGSIDLEWRGKNYILLINFNNSDNINIQYYGEDNISKTIIKGFIEDKSINSDLAFWMKKLR